MQWACGGSGNVSEHLFLGRLSSPGPMFVPKCIVWDRAWGWQSSADMENLTLSHQVYKSRQYWEDNSPIFCQGLPKALILHSQSGLQRDKDRSQTSGEMGARQAVLHWGRIMSTNPVLVPAAWLLSWWCCMGIRDRLPTEADVARGTAAFLSRWRQDERGCTHTAPAWSRSGRQVCIWKPFLTAESPLGANALPDPRQLWGRWRKWLRKCFWILEWKWRNQAEFSQEQEKRESGRR